MNLFENDSTIKEVALFDAVKKRKSIKFSFLHTSATLSGQKDACAPYGIRCCVASPCHYFCWSMEAGKVIRYRKIKNHELNRKK